MNLNDAISPANLVMGTVKGLGYGQVLDAAAAFHRMLVTDLSQGGTNIFIAGEQDQGCLEFLKQTGVLTR